MDESLVFVYNADGAPVSALIDAAHKIISPSTYECNLCKITHGRIGMKAEWKEFVRDINLPVEFLHRDEFRAEYGREDQLPCVLIKNDGLHVIIEAEEIEDYDSVDELKRAVEDALAHYRTDS